MAPESEDESNMIEIFQNKSLFELMGQIRISRSHAIGLLHFTHTYIYIYIHAYIYISVFV